VSSNHRVDIEDAESVVCDIAARYEEETRRVAEVFAGSGAGMAEAGVLVSVA
jgi:hypothetical protein